MAERAMMKKAKKAGAAVRKANGEDHLSGAAGKRGQLFVFDAAGIGSVLYEDMGLKKPANMPRQDSISLPLFPMRDWRIWMPIILSLSVRMLI